MAHCSPALLCLSACLFLSACLIPPEPRSAVKLEGPWGFAAGESPAEAARLAAAIERALPVLSELEGFVPRPLRAHVVADSRLGHLNGISVDSPRVDPWIAVSRDAPEFDFTVAHEMSHFYFRDLFASLPTVLEEGLCEHLAERVTGVSKSSQRRITLAAASYLDDFTVQVRGPGAKAGLAVLFQDVPPVDEMFEVDWRQHLRSDPRIANTLYGLGLVAVNRIGFDGVLDLVRRAEGMDLDRVPSDWILGAMGLSPPSQANLRLVFGEAVGGENVGTNGEIEFTISTPVGSGD